MNDIAIAQKVKVVYNWIDSQIAKDTASCNACGNCCNFDAYDHRLYITSPEALYFKLNVDQFKHMAGGLCPYNSDGKCTVHEHRFAGCRIFLCEGEDDFQSKLSEQAIAKFRSICKDFAIDYYYADLKTVLNEKIGS